jgi:hypothetical protein
MTPLDLYTRFRSDVDDTVEDFLWSDLEVFGYMEDAQSMLCRLTDGIRDATSEATRLDVVSGEPWVELHPSILRVRSATLGNGTRPLVILSYEDEMKQAPDYRSWPYGWNFATDEMYLSGPVNTLLIGMEEGKLRLVRTPTVDGVINLLIERLPLQTMLVESPEDLPETFEVRAEHHLALLMWMKHLAYGKQDAETFDKEKSSVMEQAFYAYCTKAMDEKKRRNHKPRLITYGGL